MTPTVLVCLSPLRACKVLILPFLFTWLPMQNFYLHIFLSTYLSVKRLWPSQWSFCDVFDYFKTLIAVCSCHTNRIIILYQVLCKTLISFAADVAQYFARFCLSCLFMIHVSPMPPASSWLVHLYVSCLFMIGASPMSPASSWLVHHPVSCSFMIGASSHVSCSLFMIGASFCGHLCFDLPLPHSLTMPFFLNHFND